MHLPALLKKSIFILSGQVFLSDPVRNRIYKWAWGHLRLLRHGAVVVDIGSRDSLFPSFLAWRGYDVRVIERDGRFIQRQDENAKNWNVRLIVDNSDFSDADADYTCDAVCSLFSLQHSGDDDIKAYRKAARILRPEGLFLSATEYSPAGTVFQSGRDDGNMRIYGPQDITFHIGQPLLSEGMTEYDRQYFALNKQGRMVTVNDDPLKAAFLAIVFKKLKK